MASHDAYLRFTLAHNAWALSRLLDECEKLTPAQFEQDFDIGPGSLRVNLAHTIEAIFFFADNFEGRAYVERDDFQALSTTILGLRSLLARASDELRVAILAAAERGLPDRIPWPSTPGRTMSAPAALAQVFDHAIAHRAQCVNMLKRLGVPAPDLDPMTFEEAGQPPTTPP
jgi:uncharacterized damage-inducible protein DinB